MKAKSFLPNYCKVIDCHSERQQVCQWVFLTFVVCAKKKTGFEISLFYWSFSSDIMGVKWLKGNQSQDASWTKKGQKNKRPNIFISMLHLLVVFMQKIGWLVGWFLLPV